jgi:hypothetical protein
MKIMALSVTFRAKAKSLSLNKYLRLNSPLKKGDRGGFALDRLEKISPPPPEGVKNLNFSRHPGESRGPVSS